MGPIERLANPTAAELADRIEAWLRGGYYKPGDALPSSMQASIGTLVCSHLPLVLEALRSVPDPAGRAALAREEEQP